MMRLQGTTKEGIQLRINQLDEQNRAGRISDACRLKLNFVVDGWLFSSIAQISLEPLEIENNSIFLDRNFNAQMTEFSLYSMK